jgi:Na+/H+-translocating membrane pyrophosphatase
MYGIAVAALGMLSTIATGLAINAYRPISLIVGAMLPYCFSAMTMKSVGSAALKMVEEVRRQFNTIPGLMKDLKINGCTRSKEYSYFQDS